jgi:hypothetical protein
LDPSLASYSGQSPYLHSSTVFTPAFGEAFYSKFGYGKLLGFYVRHPRRLASVILRGTEQAFRLRSRLWATTRKSSGSRTTRRHGASPCGATRRFDSRRLRGLWLALVLGGQSRPRARRLSPRRRPENASLERHWCSSSVSRSWSSSSATSRTRSSAPIATST